MGQPSWAKPDATPHPALVLLREIRDLSYRPDRNAARAESDALRRAAVLPARIPTVVLGRLTTYDILDWIEDGGTIETAPAIATSPSVALIHINEIMFSGLPAIANMFVEHYAATWPEDDNLARWQRLSRRANLGPTDFHDNPLDDLRIIRREGAQAVMFVFADLNNGFAIPLTALYRFFLCHLPAHIVFLRDLDTRLFVGGIRSLGSRAATLARMREIVAELGATRIATIGFSQGNFGALLYGAELGAQNVIAFAGPTALEIGLQFANKQSFRRVKEGHEAGELDWPDVRALLAANPGVRVRCFYSADNHADALHGQHLQGLPNVAVEAIPDTADHFTLDHLEVAGRLDGLLREAIGAA